MSIEAMKQALEALEANQPVNYCMNNNGEKFPMFKSDPLRQERNEKAITSLRQAIEQAEKQEPVAILDCIKEALPEFRQQDDYLLAHSASLMSDDHNEIIHIDTALRIAQATQHTGKREWVGLTDAEIEEFDYYARDLVMDLEKALKERNNVA